MKCSIIIPLHNERNTILTLLDRVRALQLDKQIIVVDDCSTDGSAEVIQGQKDLIFLRHPVNRGKGAAIRTGLEHATGEIVVMQDADLELDPNDIPRLVELVKNGAPVVYGSRFKGKGEFIARSFWANKFLTGLTNLLYGSNLTDMETCYKCMRAGIIKSLNLKANRFEIEPEITSKVLLAGHEIVEIPISYKARTEGKKINWKDGLAAVWHLLKYRLGG